MEGLQEVTNDLLNGTIRDPLRPPLLLVYGSQPPTKTPIAIISGTAKATHFNFLCTFIELIRTKTHQNNLGKVSIGIVRKSQKLSSTHM